MQFIHWQSYRYINLRLPLQKTVRLVARYLEYREESPGNIERLAS